MVLLADTDATPVRTGFLSQRQYGFTFVELLIVLAVIAIIATIIAGSMREFALRQQFQAEVNDIARSISAQRAKTLGSVADTNYGVFVTSDAIAFFASSTPGALPTETVTTTLSYSVASVSLSDGADYVSFARLTGTPSATGTIRLYSEALAATSTITIYESGSIE